MKAGRELDALVARDVLGCTVAIDPELGPTNPLCRCRTGAGHATTTGLLLRYSADIAAAWQVWEKLPYPKRLSEGDPEGDNDPEYRRFGVMCGGKEYGWDSDFSATYFGEADTAPLAICLAALKAVGVEAAV